MYSIRQVLRELNVPYEVFGVPRDGFEAITPVDQSKPDALVFFNKPDDGTLAALAARNFGVALVERAWAAAHRQEIEVAGGVIALESPRLVIGRIAALLFPDDEQVPPGVDPSAQVSPRARLHPSVSIGPFCVIGDCEIGEGSVIGAYTVIKHGCVLGKRVTVRDHCSIGGAGFGFARNAEGSLERIPHLGGVVLEDDVELFPYVNVDRATFGTTRVGRGTKIDHYCHIGHNSMIGPDTVITAGVVLCGGSRIGERCWVGVGTIVKEKTGIGADATTGLGAVVLRDVPAGAVVAGVPAKPLR